MKKTFIEKGGMTVQRSCAGTEGLKDYDYTTNLFVALVHDLSREVTRYWIREVVNAVWNWNRRDTMPTGN